MGFISPGFSIGIPSGKPGVKFNPLKPALAIKKDFPSDTKFPYVRTFTMEYYFTIFYSSRILIFLNQTG